MPIRHKSSNGMNNDGAEEVDECGVGKNTVDITALRNDDVAIHMRNSDVDVNAIVHQGKVGVRNANGSSNAVDGSINIPSGMIFSTPQPRVDTAANADDSAVVPGELETHQTRDGKSAFTGNPTDVPPQGGIHKQKHCKRMTAQAGYNKKHWDKKKRQRTDTDRPPAKLNTDLRYATGTTKVAGDVIRTVKGYYETFKKAAVPFPKERPCVVHAAMGVLYAALDNPGIYKPHAEGPWIDVDLEGARVLTIDEKNSNRRQLQSYFRHQLKLPVSDDYNHQNSLMSRLCRSMSILKLISREEFAEKFIAARKHFTTIRDATTHVRTKSTCTIPHCPLCNGSVTSDSYYTEKTLWKNNGMIFYTPQPHLDCVTVNDHDGVLPAPIASVTPPVADENANFHAPSENGFPLDNVPTGTLAPPNPDRHNRLPCCPLFSQRDVGGGDNCLFVGSSLHDPTDGATIFAPLSSYHGNVLTDEECSFVESTLPRALTCRGSVAFFSSLMEKEQYRRNRSNKPNERQSSIFIQGDCLGLYAGAENEGVRSNSSMKQFLRIFCPDYKDCGLDILRRYAQAQLFRDPRTSSRQHTIRGHTLVVCLAGAPQQNIHGHPSPHFQCSLTLTPETEMTRIYYGMKQIPTFAALVDLWNSLEICKKFNLHIPGIRYSKFLGKYEKSIVTKFGAVFHPTAELQRHCVGFLKSPMEFPNRPGTQAIVSGAFLRAGPGLPSLEKGAKLPTPPNNEHNLVLTDAHHWQDVDMEPAPAGSLRAELVFDTYVEDNGGCQYNDEVYGASGMFHIANRLSTIVTNEERMGLKWLLADYVFLSSSNVLPFLSQHHGSPLYDLVAAIEQRRGNWLASAETGAKWHEDIKNLIILWSHGCTFDRNIFDTALSAKLRSFGIQSLLTKQGRTTITDIGCFWVDSRGITRMLEMFDSMVRTSTKHVSCRDASIKDTNMTYSKGASTKGGGISTVVAKKYFVNTNQALRNTYTELGKILEENIEARIREERSIDDSIKMARIICSVMRSTESTKVQDWHYDYPRATESTSSTANAVPVNSFSSITPLALGGSYLRLYNPKTNTPFILHIPHGFTFVMDNNTIHAEGYLFDACNSDKRLRHYFVFQGGPSLANNHKFSAISTEDTLVYRTIQRHFQDNDNAQEDCLKRDGWFLF